MKPCRIVSGGQTGVDRAALDAARETGLPMGGWCPAGRLAEDGPIPEEYPLMETPESAYAQRTEWNVRDSDATLILYEADLFGGTELTAALARRMGRPCLPIDLRSDPGVERVRHWIQAHRVSVLNVAGPRESGCPGIYRRALRFLREVFAEEVPPDGG